MTRNVRGALLKLTNVPEAMAEKIELAVRQFGANKTYPASHRVVATAAHLDAIAKHAAALRSVLMDLSPIGFGLLYDTGQTDFEPEYAPEEKWNEWSISVFAADLLQLEEISIKAGARLELSYSNIPSDGGQGANSGKGRSPDLVLATIGSPDHPHWPPLRMPKDKLGVAIIRAMVAHQDILEVAQALGSRASLKQFLDLVWHEQGLGKLPDWSALLAHRVMIIGDLTREYVIFREWAEAARSRRT